MINLFHFIFIGKKTKWPRVTKHRGKKDKEGFYFGPFASAEQQTGL